MKSELPNPLTGENMPDHVIRIKLKGYLEGLPFYVTEKALSDELINELRYMEDLDSIIDTYINDINNMFHLFEEERNVLHKMLHKFAVKSIMRARCRNDISFFCRAYLKYKGHPTIYLDGKEVYGRDARFIHSLVFGREFNSIGEVEGFISKTSLDSDIPCWMLPGGYTYDYVLDIKRKEVGV